MNRRARLAAASLAAAATIGVATPAHAETAMSCRVSPDGYARLSVTRYPVSGGVQYHMDLNSSTPILGLKYYQMRISISGVNLGGTDDVYRTYVGTQTRTVRGYWTTSQGMTVSCQVTL